MDYNWVILSHLQLPNLVVQALIDRVTTLKQGYANLPGEWPNKPAQAAYQMFQDCIASLTKVEDEINGDLHDVWHSLLTQDSSSSYCSNIIDPVLNLKNALEKEVNAIAEWLENPTLVIPVETNSRNPSFDRRRQQFRVKTTRPDLLHLMNLPAFSSPEDILDVFYEKLLSCEGKSEREIVRDNKILTELGDRLNRLGVVARCGNQDDDASQLLYALTTGNVNDVDWANKIKPILARGNSRWPHVIASVQKAGYLNHRLSSIENWSDKDVSYVNLKGINLENYKGEDSTCFQFTDLRGANLSHANLNRANLRYTNLENANLSNAYLLYANLTNASLLGAKLRRARCEQCIDNLQTANITDADFRETSYHLIENTELAVQIRAQNLKWDLNDIENAQSLNALVVIENHLFPYQKQDQAISANGWPFSLYEPPQKVSLCKTLQNKTQAITGLSRAVLPITAQRIEARLKKSQTATGVRDRVFSKLGVDNEKIVKYKITLDDIEKCFLPICRSLLNSKDKNIVSTLRNIIIKIRRKEFVTIDEDFGMVVDPDPHWKSVGPVSLAWQKFQKDERNDHLVLRQVYKIIFEASLPPATELSRRLWAECLTYIEMTHPEFNPPQNKEITREEVSNLITAHEHEVFKKNRSLSIFKSSDSLDIWKIKKQLLRVDLTDEQRYKVLWFYMFDPGNHHDDFHKVVWEKLIESKGKNFFEKEEAATANEASSSQPAPMLG